MAMSSSPHYHALMPFGLKNVGATTQHAVIAIFSWDDSFLLVFAFSF